MENNYYDNHKTQIDEFIYRAIKEDIGVRDITTAVLDLKETNGEAYIISKSDGNIAGVQLAELIFNYFDPSLTFTSLIEEAEFVPIGRKVLTIKGNIQSILNTERVVLNCLQRMSAITSQAKKLSELIKHTSCKILDTRKTTPNFRIIEKWAVNLGGCYNHRFGLYDEILIKDNHIDITGGIERTLNKIELYKNVNEEIEKVIIECRNLDEVEKVLNHSFKVDRILLDNMRVEEIKEALKTIQGKIKTEVSGNINLSNLVEYAETGVDFISMGMLTYAYNSIDLSMKIANKN